MIDLRKYACRTCEDTGMCLNCRGGSYPAPEAWCSSCSCTHVCGDCTPDPIAWTATADAYHRSAVGQLHDACLERNA